MISLRVLAPGFQTTVQDLGRFGYAHLGISASGAADSMAFRIANRLAGNDENTPALEMTLTGSTLYFEGMPNDAPLVAALTGSDFLAQLDGVPVPLWQAISIKPGQTLRMGGTTSGARCYFAVRSGLRIATTLGSASTHLLSHFGGHLGRALKRGDVLEIGSTEKAEDATTKINSEFVAAISQRATLRITPGPQVDWFPESSLRELCSRAYLLTEASNRTGLRLTGDTILPSHNDQLLTEGASLGAVQIPPDGQPIIVFVEQQTTGGYPKIANVIAADLHRLGQLRPRDQVKFEMVTLEQARTLLMQQEEALQHALAMV